MNVFYVHTTTLPYILEVDRARKYSARATKSQAYAISLFLKFWLEIQNQRWMDSVKIQILQFSSILAANDPN